MIFFAFSDNLSAENSKLSADSRIQRIQLLECMITVTQMVWYVLFWYIFCQRAHSIDYLKIAFGVPAICNSSQKSLFLIFPHIWLGTNVTNYCTYRKAKRHRWKPFHREKYRNNPKLLSEKYDFACFPLFNILHRMSKIHEENIQQQSSYYFLNIETLSLKIIRKVLFLTLSISIAFKKSISRYIPGDGLMMRKLPKSASKGFIEF